MKEKRNHCDVEVLERRLLLATQAITYDLERDWSDAQNPNGVWSLNEGDNHLLRIADWKATNQSAWARQPSGDHSNPAWFKVSTLSLPDAQLGDVVVNTANVASASGPANLEWTSPAAGIITISGGVWDAANTTEDHNWTLYDGSTALSSGTILGSEFTRDHQFSLALGSNGPSALSNIRVKAGDKIKFLVTSSDSDYVGVDFKVAFNPSDTPTYDLGLIPTQIATDGQPVRFVVNQPSAVAPLRMQLNAQPLGAVNFDSATGKFTYTPDPRDKFNFSVLFIAGDGGAWDASSAQSITISPSTTSSDTAFVAQPKPLPDEQSRDYITVSEQKVNVPGGHFNAVARMSARAIEISGKTIVIKPGDPNGLFERIAYTDAAGNSVVNSDIQSLSIYAENVVIAAKLHLPQTNVIIWAKNLKFDDSSGPAQIDTTPLGYRTSAMSAHDGLAGANGLAGENAGNVVLHVGSISSPATAAKRFILHGGTGQAAGQGKAGAPGSSMPSFAYDTTSGRYTNVVALIHDGDPTRVIAGTAAWPGNGQAAIAGGRPGNGGSGGQVLNFANIELAQLTDFAGGAPGSMAANQPGGSGGTPRTATWVTERFHPDRWELFATHSSLDAPGWAATGANAGSAGQIQAGHALPDDWLHPSALRAMISYAKDAYIGGNIDFAAQTFGDYGRMLDSITSPPDSFAQEFAEMRADIAQLENRAVNRLDFFGNPVGWTPTLSFAANFRAYERQIDVDIRILFLTRLIQTSTASQQAVAAAITQSLAELNSTIGDAVDRFDSSQALLPELQHQLDIIENQTNLVQQQLAAKERELEARAANNVKERHKLPAWKESLDVLSAVASVIPIPSVQAAGIGLGAISNFLSNPTVSNLSAFKGVTNPFTKAQLDASSAEWQKEISLLKLPSGASPDQLKGYVNQLSTLGKKWGPILDAYKNATKATGVPATEVQAELDSLKAQDPTFKALVDEINKLAGQKQAFAQDLARALQAISDAVKQITTDYASADTLTAQLSNLSGGLRLDTLERVKEMGQAAHDRLLKYQYDMAKAFEYEMLRPYAGNLQLSHLLDAITIQLGNNPDVSWLDNPTNFASLKAVYESDLSATADAIWTNLNTNGPQRTSSLSFRLSPQQLDALNTQGEVTINLVDLGFISPLQQDAKIIQIGASQITSTLHGPFAQIANVRFDFDHAGSSIVQSHGQKYAFQHYTSSTETPIFWATDYDAIRGGAPIQAGVSPSQIASITTLLGLDPASITPDQADRIYAHPGAWADITIRKTVTTVPASVGVDLQEMWLSVRYDSDRPQVNTVALDVRSSQGLSPEILIGKKSVTENVEKERGSFAQFLDQGQAVTLTAQPEYGQFRFIEWQDGAGQTIGTDPALSLAMNRSEQVYPIYEIAPTPTVSFAGYEFATAPRIRIRFTSDMRPSLTGDDLNVVNMSTGQVIPATTLKFSISSSAPNLSEALWIATQPLPDGNYHATLVASGLVDANDNALASDVNFDFFVLAGDANHDRSVNFADLVAVAQNYGASSGATFAKGDFNYDGKVDFTDLVTVAQKYGTTLAAPVAAAPVAAPATASPPVKPMIARSTLLSRPIKSLFSVEPIAKPAPSKSRALIGPWHH